MVVRLYVGLHSRPILDAQELLLSLDSQIKKDHKDTHLISLSKSLVSTIDNLDYQEVERTSHSIVSQLS